MKRSEAALAHVRERLLSYHQRSGQLVILGEIVTRCDIFGGGVRLESGQYQRKVRRNFVDVREGVRLALSMEERVAPPAPGVTPVLTREKHRWSALDEPKGVRIDLTKVISESSGNSANHAPDTFEIEVECINGKGHFVGFMSALSDILGLLNAPTGVSCNGKRVTDNSVAQKGTALDRVLDEYKRFFRRANFVGAQPETMHMEHVKHVRAIPYSVTLKAKGTRALLIILENGSAYLIDRSMRITPAGPTQGSVDSRIVLRHVVDVEVCHERIVAFDILVHESRDLRGNASYPFNARLEVLRKVAAEPRSSFTVKEYHPYRWGMSVTLEAIVASAEGDGLIFLPESEPYPVRSQWKNLLKWKPSSENSIDFLLHNSQLCVGDVESRLVPFSPQLEVVVSLVEGESDGTDVPKEGDIVECTLSNDGSKFQIVRVRRDKPRPNFRTVAYDVWKSMRQPVDLRRLNISGHQAIWTHHAFVKNQMAKQCVDICRSERQDSRKLVVLNIDATCRSIHWTKLGEHLDIRTIASNSENLHLNIFDKLDALDALDQAAQFDIITAGWILNDASVSEWTDAHWAKFWHFISKHLRPKGVFTCFTYDVHTIAEMLRRKMDDSTSLYKVFTEFNPDTFWDELGPSDEGASFALQNHSQARPQKHAFLTSARFISNALKHDVLCYHTTLFPPPLDDSIQLSPAECMYTRLHRQWIFRKAVGQLEETTSESMENKHGWMASTPEEQACFDGLRLDVPPDFGRSLSVSTHRYRVSEIIYAVANAGLPLGSMVQMSEAQLADSGNVTLHIINRLDGRVRTYEPAHSADDTKCILFASHEPAAKGLSVLGVENRVDGSHLIIFNKLPPSQMNAAMEAAQSAAADAINVLQARTLDRSKDAWKIKELQDFAETHNVSIPPSIKRKAEIFEHILQTLQDI